jgi:hypothetical protein
MYTLDKWQKDHQTTRKMAGQTEINTKPLKQKTKLKVMKVQVTDLIQD